MVSKWHHCYKSCPNQQSVQSGGGKTIENIRLIGGFYFSLSILKIWKSFWIPDQSSCGLSCRIPFQFSATVHLYSWDSWGFSCDWINQGSDTGAIKKIYHDHLVLARHSWLLANTAGSRVEGRKTRGVLEKECVHHRGRKNLQSLSSFVDFPGRVHQAIINSKQHLPQPPIAAAQQILGGPVAPIWPNHVQSLIPTHPHDSEESATMNIWLVVLTILKNMKVNGKDYPIYYGK